MTIHPTRDESAIRAELEAWSESIRHKDVEGVLSHFADQTVRFFLAPPLETETPLRDNLESWFRTFNGNLCYEIRQLVVTESAGLACTNSLNRITGTKQDGQKTNLWFRQTLVLRFIEERWRIIHIHESVPFYMDGTYRAAADLQPTSLG
ncbi:YybH family protein [Prosthecobacter fusiformis]|nr:nuclear transport factor 2 family protein [Prosthecobacter fusiformis]